MARVRLSYQGLQILKLFVEAPERPRTGADVIRALDISSGTVYPLLHRFKASGVLRSRWETERPEVLGRPRRQLYLMTAGGLALARVALADVRVN